MTAAEARSAAAEEGLSLLTAENLTGFKGVSRNPSSASKPFKVQIGAKYLGTFATAEEAALAVARFLGPEGVVSEREVADLLFPRQPDARAQLRSLRGEKRRWPQSKLNQHHFGMYRLISRSRCVGGRVCAMCGRGATRGHDCCCAAYCSAECASKHAAQHAKFAHGGMGA